MRAKNKPKKTGLKNILSLRIHQLTGVEKKGAAVRLFSTKVHSMTSFFPAIASNTLDVNLAPAKA